MTTAAGQHNATFDCFLTFKSNQSKRSLVRARFYQEVRSSGHNNDVNLLLHAPVMSTPPPPTSLRAPSSSRSTSEVLGRRNGSKLRQPFKSPIQATTKPSEVRSDNPHKIQELHKKLHELDSEIQVLKKEYHEDELQHHIEKLHEYNEIKDVGQLLIGRLGELEGKTTRSLYAEFGLNVED
ncbi:DNA repair protein SWI5 homolog isoform X2 [Nematostella vectensis]|uniref:DNA repair protein SWI5 homolog isoform X2 n=1 Tax=Nematostella vectensis TaxID=45351 RepID=UPI002077094F|nr:DNA repair protein SWI5 homolog isoform X2 [Nematostella vectensis]